MQVFNSFQEVYDGQCGTPQGTMSVFNARYVLDTNHPQDSEGGWNVTTVVQSLDGVNNYLQSLAPLLDDLSADDAYIADAKSRTANAVDLITGIRDDIRGHVYDPDEDFSDIDDNWE